MSVRTNATNIRQPFRSKLAKVKLSLNNNSFLYKNIKSDGESDKINK